MTAPPGSYQLQYGVAYAPALHRIVAVVAPGVLQAVVTRSDKPAELALGGPLLDFVATNDNGAIKINPATIHLRGKNGEEYVGFQYDRAFAPEVTLSAAGKDIPLARMSFT